MRPRAAQQSPRSQESAGQSWFEPRAGSLYVSLLSGPGRLESRTLQMKQSDVGFNVLFPYQVRNDVQNHNPNVRDSSFNAFHGSFLK